MKKSILIVVAFCCLLLPASVMADSISADWLGSRLTAGGVDISSVWNGRSVNYQFKSNWNIEVGPVPFVARNNYPDSGTTVNEALNTFRSRFHRTIANHFARQRPDDGTIVAVPEPSVLVLLGTCLAVFVGVRNRRKIR